jgi:hypothetical protein
MNQALYAHMNNKRKMKKKKDPTTNVNIAVQIFKIKGLIFELQSVSHKYASHGVVGFA